MDTEALEQHIVNCSCVTKTPEVKYHQPWCSYRQVAALKERIEALEAAAEAVVGSWMGDTVLASNNQRFRPVDAKKFDALRALLPGGDE